MTRRANDFLQAQVVLPWSRKVGDEFVLAGSHAANTDGGTQTNIVAKLNRRAVITKVRYYNATGLANHGSNFAVLSLKQGSVIAATWSTETGQEGTIAAGTWVDFTLGNTAASIVELDESLTFVVAESGTTTVPAGQWVAYGKYVEDDCGFRIFRAKQTMRVDQALLSLASGVAANTTDYYIAQVGKLHDLTVADLTFTGEADDDLATAAAHGLLTGDGPVRVSNAGGALPTGLATSTDYWIVKASASTFSFATSLANALAGNVINLTGDGTGTQTLADVVGRTKRFTQVAEYDTRAAGEGALTSDEFGTMDLSDTSTDLVLAAGDELYLHFSEAGDTVLSDIQLCLHGRYL